MTHPHRFSTLLTAVCLLAVASCSTTSTRTDPEEGPHRELAAALAQLEQTGTSSSNLDDSRRKHDKLVEQVVALWQSEPGQPSRDRSIEMEQGGRRLRLAATWPGRIKFDELVPVTPAEKRKLSHQVLRLGVGTPFVAHWKHTEERKKTDPLLSEVGYLTPVTVTVEFKPLQGFTRDILLHIHDPRHEESVVLSGRRQPLAADFSAPGEWILAAAKTQKDMGMSGFAALRNSEKYLDKLGLISLEPPAPDRVPVIFVHGLMSRPLTWQNALNELNGDPVIRKNYQVFFFRYPTGVPVVYSSSKFREQLATLHSELDRIGNHRSAHHMVLIGHSMGGLLSKMQLTSSGDRLWVNIFGAKASDLHLTHEELAAFRKYLEFKPNPYIDRVIFVCTPHRGSQMAQGFFGAVARSLVSLPGRVLGKTFDVIQGTEPQSPVMQKLLKSGIPTSVENLSPDSRFVKESMQLPLKPGLHVHSIVGNKSGKPLTDPKCSDGVVPYTSAHLAGAESELVVHSNHSAHATKEAIAEMRRILLLHLSTLSMH